MHEQVKEKEKRQTYTMVTSTIIIIIATDWCNLFKSVESTAGMEPVKRVVKGRCLNVYIFALLFVRTVQKYFMLQ